MVGGRTASDNDNNDDDNIEDDVEEDEDEDDEDEEDEDDEEHEAEDDRVTLLVLAVLEFDVALFRSCMYRVIVRQRRSGKPHDARKSHVEDNHLICKLSKREKKKKKKTWQKNKYKLLIILKINQG
eukprot:TRINITY_DN23713_c0_g1_i1.p1 TRINITY_DN23713_c0_g1~~TRINITY_DN23713_c0_g1_i1.p1  ORF type:complete len:126 (-),score=19.91 TRINITY_DN23713_c0_g1_i1:120-497(-)